MVQLNSGIVLQVTYRNFLESFKFVIVQSTALIDLYNYQLYQSLFGDLEELLNVKFLTQNNLPVALDEDLYRLFVRKTENIKIALGMTIKGFDMMHKNLQTIILNTLICQNADTGKPVRIDWPNSVFAEKIKLPEKVVAYQELQSLYVWQWLHIISLNKSIQSSHEKTDTFLDQVTLMILCGQCQSHYTRQLPTLKKLIRTSTSLYYVLLNLHGVLKSHNPADSIDSGKNCINYQYDILYRGLYTYCYTLNRPAVILPREERVVII